MSLKDRILDVIEEGEKEASEKGAFFAHWWEYFELRCNPFFINPLNPKKDELDSNLFVNQEGILKELGKLIGQSKYARNLMKVAVVGPTGIGKRTIARILYWIIDETKRKGFIFDVWERTYVHPMKETESSRLPDDSDLCFVILENMQGIERAKMYFDMYNHRDDMLLISFWTPEVIPDDLDDQLRIKIEPLDNNEIKEMLAKRIHHCGGEASILTKGVVRKIVKYSEGIPLLALNLATWVFTTCFRRRGNIPTKDDVETAAREHSYIFKSESFSERELKVLHRLALIGKTSPNEFAEELSISRVMAWKYLNRFFEAGYLRRQTVGKSYQYELTTPGLVRIQIELMARRS